MSKPWMSALCGAAGGALVTAVVLFEAVANRDGKDQQLNHPRRDAAETIAKFQISERGSALNQRTIDASHQPLKRVLDRIGQIPHLDAVILERLHYLLYDSVRVDPIMAAETIAAADSPHQVYVWRRFLQNWFQQHGIALLDELPRRWSDDHPELYRKVLATAIQVDPPAAVDRSLTMGDSVDLGGLLINLSYAVTPEQTSLVFRVLNGLPEAAQRNFLAHDAHELASKAPHRLLAWASSKSSELEAAATDAALSALAWQQPERALSLLNDHRVSDRRQIVRRALKQLALREPQLAAAGAEAEGRYHAEVARSWAESDPGAASTWLIEQTPQQRRLDHDPLLGIASNWARRDREAALAFGDGLSGNVQSLWIGTIAATLELADIAGLEAMAQRYAGTDIAAGTDIEVGIQQRLLSRRYQADPDAAVAALDDLAPTVRDATLSSLISHRVRGKPGIAIPLLEKIENKEQRMNGLSRVLRRWQRAEDGAMERWLVEEASPVLRDEAYSALAAQQPALLSFIGDRELRVATYLQTRPQTAHATSRVGMMALLTELDLSDTQWQALDDAAQGAALAHRADQ